MKMEIEWSLPMGEFQAQIPVQLLVVYSFKTPNGFNSVYKQVELWQSVSE